MREEIKRTGLQGAVLEYLTRRVSFQRSSSYIYKTLHSRDSLTCLNLYLTLLLRPFANAVPIIDTWSLQIATSYSATLRHPAIQLFTAPMASVNSPASRAHRYALPSISLLFARPTVTAYMVIRILVAIHLINGIVWTFCLTFDWFAVGPPGCIHTLIQSTLRRRCDCNKYVSVIILCY